VLSPDIEWQCKNYKVVVSSRIAWSPYEYSLHAIPIEVLALALIEFVFVSTFAAVLWYMFGHK
jgi:hypothetical protein